MNGWKIVMKYVKKILNIDFVNDSNPDFLQSVPCNLRHLSWRDKNLKYYIGKKIILIPLDQDKELSERLDYLKDIMVIKKIVGETFTPWGSNGIRNSRYGSSLTYQCLWRIKTDFFSGHYISDINLVLWLPESKNYRLRTLRNHIKRHLDSFIKYEGGKRDKETYF